MTLQIKLGITGSPELAQEEERISKRKAIDMFDAGFLDILEAGSVRSLLDIHHELFADIYDFAGLIRDVNIAKGNFRFGESSIQISIHHLFLFPPELLHFKAQSLRGIGNIALA